jgi:hypothetical protein
LVSIPLQPAATEALRKLGDRARITLLLIDYPAQQWLCLRRAIAQPHELTENCRQHRASGIVLPQRHGQGLGKLPVPEGEVPVDDELATPGGGRLGSHRLKPRQGQDKIIAGFRYGGGWACEE